MRRWTLPVICLALLVAFAEPAAAAIHVGWHFDKGISLKEVVEAPDGSIYIVGDRRRSITAAAFLMKLSPTGRTRWSRSWLPNPHASTDAVAVDLMPNGNVVWTGVVQQQCEGNGWFVQVNRPNGTLVNRYVTPGWQCSIAESVTDIAASADRIVVSGLKHGCCADLFQDGFVEALDPTAHPTWRTNVEPPAPTPHAWFDAATGISIGAFGNMYVSGWGATKPLLHETSRSAGTMVLWKVTSGGGVLWSRRVGGVPMPSMDAPVAVSARGDAVMVAAGVRGFGVRWHLGEAPTDGWLGRFTTGGSLVWSRHWDTKNPSAAEPTNVAIDTSGATWVVGTRRTVRNKGLDLFVRRYDSGGGLLGKASLNKRSRFLHGTGVAPRFGGGAFATGWFGEDITKGGRLWRLFA
jgi:hypothetical protein